MGKRKLFCVGTCMLLIFFFSVQTARAQSRWRPYLGVYASTDAYGVYIGPSFLGGTDFILNKDIVLSTYLQYFGSKADRNFETYWENGTYRAGTFAILVQKNYLQNKKGFQGSAGLAIQKRIDDYYNDIWEFHMNRWSGTLAFRAGYRFPVRRNTLLLELSTTGPDPKLDEDYPELLPFTQVSIGIHFFL